MSDSFATVEDLAVLLNVSFDDGETNQAQMLLDDATTAIRAEAHQHLSFVEDDIVVLAGSWSYDLELPEWPVVDVTAVAVNGVAITDPGSFQWNTRQLLRRTGILAELTGSGMWQQAPGSTAGYAGHWGGPGGTVAVTYSHGYATIPDDLVKMCRDLAAAVVVNPEGLDSESLGAYQVRYVRGAGGPKIELTDAQRRLIRARYRH